MRKLHSIMHEILQSNHEISNQLQKLMARPGPPGFCDARSVRADAMSIFSTSTAATARSFAFEAILRKSRAYKQKGLWQDNSSVVSHGNSINVCSWTLLSQLSLGELSTSEISVSPSIRPTYGTPNTTTFQTTPTVRPRKVDRLKKLTAL